MYIIYLCLFDPFGQSYEQSECYWSYLHSVLVPEEEQGCYDRSYYKRNDPYPNLQKISSKI